MKTKLIIPICLIFMAIGCGKDGGSIIDLFIPNLSNQWISNRNSNFFFLPEQDNVSESNFNGNEVANDDGVAQPFTGHFKNYDISFKFEDGPRKGETYSGKLIKGSNPLRMELKGDKTSGKLIITRNE
jgi:hypothetical protein